MQSILKSHMDSKQFAHAYLLYGNVSAAKEKVYEAAEVILGISGRPDSHPDFYYGKFDVAGIGESHAIREWSATRPFMAGGKVTLIEAMSFTIEAANALLKTIEEPASNIYYFIITPSPENIIPTLRSRLIMERVGEADRAEGEFALEFLGKDPADRFKMAKKIIPDKGESKETFLEFLNSLEIEVEKRTGSSKKFAKALGEIVAAENWAVLKGSSSKMILEHLALVLPIIKKELE